MRRLRLWTRKCAGVGSLLCATNGTFDLLRGLFEHQAINTSAEPCESDRLTLWSASRGGKALPSDGRDRERLEQMQDARTTTRIECYGATRPQQGRSQNEDAFLISTGDRPFAALADGAGNAEQAAKRVLTMFEKLLNEAIPEQIADAGTWAKWVKLLDSSLLGAAQSTFVAVTIADKEVIGACAGDSRTYLINREGQCKIITDGASKQRLGSGQAQAFPIRLTLGAGDILLLLSDGAWTPLNLYALQMAAVNAAVRHFSEVPAAILEAAGRTGRADDMTAIALKLIR
jgi:serine/threonine protein phosphatase PrpC